MRDFEKVLQLDDWYDGPRAGVALFGAVPHKFQSRLLDVREYRDEYESADLFELTPVAADPATPVVIASATFRRVPDDPGSGWEVAWSPTGLPSA